MYSYFRKQFCTATSCHSCVFPKVLVNSPAIIRRSHIIQKSRANTGQVVLIRRCYRRKWRGVWTDRPTYRGAPKHRQLLTGRMLFFYHVSPKADVVGICVDKWRHTRYWFLCEPCPHRYSNLSHTVHPMPYWTLVVNAKWPTEYRNSPLMWL